MHLLLKSFVALLRQILPHRERNSGSVEHKELSAELLEPRILYSAAPISVEGEVSAAPVEQTPAQAAEVVAAQSPSPAVERPTPVTVPAGEEAPVEAGDSEVSPTQDIELVDVDAASATLNQEIVEAMAAEARQRWIESGISEEQIAALDAVEYRVADVGGAHLGVADGFSITIDDDAGGTGVGNWFIDATPGDDVEFGNGVSAASGRYDLLSTLIHEQGHVLGLSDIFADRTNAMDGFLDAGTRRLPVEGQAEGAVAGSITGGNFLTANIIRASTDGAGVEGDNSSYAPVISANGRYAAFESDATNLVAGGTNGLRQIYVKDLVTGGVALASSDASGAQATGGWSFGAVISADGRYVAFYSDANNLVAGDTNNRTDVFVKDLQTGAITRASTDSSGGESDGFSYTPSLSADGRYVVFESDATNLVGGDNNGAFDVFVKDLDTGELSRVSVSSNGSDASAGSHSADISANGRNVSFTSAAADLVTGDTNGADDIFVKDLKTGSVNRVSTRSGGGESTGGGAHYSAISADGRFVAFASNATNLVDDDNNGERDIFVKDLRTNRTTRVSTDSAGVESNDESILFNAGISDDGRFVVFHSDASNLVTGDGNGETDVFVKDLKTGSTTRVSTDASGNETTGAGSTTAAISADGRFVAFHSSATDLVTGDTNGNRDIFVKAISSINPYATSVHVDGSGNLIIEDIEGADSKDNLLVEMKDGRLEISDRKNTVGSSIFGSMLVGTKGRAVSIDPASFSGDIIIRLLGGDDQIAIGDLSGLPAGIVVEDGDGHDVIRHKGVVTLTGAAGVSYRSEQIRLERNSTIDVVDGVIELRGNDGETSTKKSVGVFSDRSSLSASGSGEIFVVGIGGAAGGGNRGVELRNTNIDTAVGNLRIWGIGGRSFDGGGNEGIRIGRGSVLETGGSGWLRIDGLGRGGGSGNRGVWVQSDVLLKTDAGQLTILGDVEFGRSSNVGVLIQKAQLSSNRPYVNPGTYAINVEGEGGGTGSGNSGVALRGTILQASNSGDIRLSGFGANSSQGSSNRGMDISGVTVTAAGGGDLAVVGMAGNGTSSNTAIRAVKSTFNSELGRVAILGNLFRFPEGNGNRGVDLSRVSVSAGTSLSIAGRSGGGKSGNDGVRLVSTTLNALGSLSIEGTANPDSTGSGNRGIFARKVEATGADVSVSGAGGNGTDRNDAVYLISGELTAIAGSVEIDGEGENSVEGRGKAGIYLRNVNVEAATSVLVDGRAGGGDRGNWGVTIVGGSFDASGSTLMVSGTGSGVTGSIDGNYGAKISRATFTSAGDLEIEGVAGRGRAGNFGLWMQASTVVSPGGEVSITGRASSGNNGKGNFGLRGQSTDITGTEVTMVGTGGAGTNGNYGFRFDSGSVTATTGRVLITGEASGNTIGTGNFGLLIARSGIGAKGDLVVRGEAGGIGTNGNFGARLSKVTGTSNAIVRLTGMSSEDSTGRGNYGLYLDNSSFNATTQSIIAGTGGGGSNDNYGLRMNRGLVNSGTTTDLVGMAFGSTTGKKNSGVYLYNGVTLAGADGININGTGGGGTGMNFGVFMNKNITAPGANVGRISTDGVSANEAGDYFDP